MAYECLRMGPEDLRILVSSEMVRVFSVGASGTCTIVVEAHLRYMITGISSTKLLQNLFSLHFNKLCEKVLLRDCWCHIIVLNVHSQTEGNADDVKNSFCEELERVFDNFPKYHMKILLGNFNAKVGREDIFKLTIGSESLHEIS
jgi:hypothetical protein